MLPVCKNSPCNTYSFAHTWVLSWWMEILMILGNQGNHKGKQSIIKHKTKSKLIQQKPIQIKISKISRMNNPRDNTRVCRQARAPTCMHIHNLDIYIIYLCTFTMHTHNLDIYLCTFTNWTFSLYLLLILIWSFIILGFIKRKFGISRTKNWHIHKKHVHEKIEHISIFNYK